VRELAAAGSLPNLRRLKMEWGTFTETGVEVLVNSPLAERLEDFDISGTPVIGPAGIEALAGSPRLARLKRLDLSNCARWGKGLEQALRHMCESPHLAALKVLELRNSWLGDKILAQVCQSRPEFRLAELSLVSQQPTIEDAGAEALAAWPALVSVRRLNLECNNIGAAGGLALARSPHLGNIAELNLEENPVRDYKKAMAALRDRFGKALRV